MKYCKRCNKQIKNTNKDFCKSCYATEKRLYQLITYPLPKKGEVAYTPDGKVVCHICGKSFNAVLSHARQYHKISALDYKKEFGLDTTKGLLSDLTKQKHINAVNSNYDTVVIENLVNKGKETRYIKGSFGRTKDKVSLQTKIKLIKRIQTTKINDTFFENIRQKEIVLY